MTYYVRFLMLVEHVKNISQAEPFNAANNGRLVVVIFVQLWRSHAQKARLQGCPSHEVADVAWPCYVFIVSELATT